MIWGTDYSNLRLWSVLCPHYVKIDNYFTQNILEVEKKEFIRSIRDIATRLHCQIIAECIETEECYSVFAFNALQRFLLNYK